MRLGILVKEQNMTKVSRYERVRIVSSRALQISQGAPVLVKLPKGVTDPKEIASLEWEAGVIPIEARKKAI